MAQKLFLLVLEHLKTQSPGFAAGKARRPAFRFKMLIYVNDSSTLELVAKVKTLQRLLTCSFSGKALAVNPVSNHLAA
jgi:hypothetical protein